MASRQPIVQVAGEFQQLQSADTLPLNVLATIAAGNGLANAGTSTASATAVGLPVLIASGTWTNVATGDIDLSTFNTLYSSIEVELINVRPATNAATLQARLATTNGTTFVTT